jgi:hypothetical protein
VSRFAPDAIDFGDAHEERVDGISAVYRVSQNTLCIELYANKVVDGEVKKVVVMRNTWDRASWLASQQVIAQMFAEVAALPLPDTPADEAVRIH